MLSSTPLPPQPSSINGEVHVTNSDRRELPDVIDQDSANLYATVKTFTKGVFNLTLFSINLSQVIFAGRQKTGDWAAVVSLASVSIALQLIIFAIVLGLGFTPMNLHPANKQYSTEVHETDHQQRQKGARTLVPKVVKTATGTSHETQCKGKYVFHDRAGRQGETEYFENVGDTQRFWNHVILVLAFILLLVNTTITALVNGAVDRSASNGS